MYKILKPILFLLPPEWAHVVTLTLLKLLHKANLLNIFLGNYNKKAPHCRVKAFGLDFDNPIGIAAGLDKNGDYIDCLAALGVGFIEVGAVTPKAQSGNRKPRLFRLTKNQALINRMGFNNKGVDYLVRKLQQRSTKCIIGVNIGKNKDTPLVNAKDDYVYCLEKIYQYADFATLNISSPNTADLRQLQAAKDFTDLLSCVLKRRDELHNLYGKKLPVLVKIAPDIGDNELASILQVLQQLQADGIIVSNTTTARDMLPANTAHVRQTGGLSGLPLKDISFRMLQKVKQYNHYNDTLRDGKLHNDKLVIISCGGIDSANEAITRLTHGATLVQIYTGLVYQGPRLLKECIYTCKNALFTQEAG